MTRPEVALVKLRLLDDETRVLVRTAAVLTVGDELAVRAALVAALSAVRAVWVEELLLQTYLFAGFPRALNAAREWRRVSGIAASSEEQEDALRDTWAERGERTCATVYGPFYQRLRVNIRELHPALDTWMIEEGYGKVLGRPQLDLARRELCIVVACAVARQDRQLHSHLHGALHAGAHEDAVSQSLATIVDMLSDSDVRRYDGLWARVQGK